MENRKWRHISGRIQEQNGSAIFHQEVSKTPRSRKTPMIQNEIPSKAILELARTIQFQKTGTYSASYQVPGIEYQMMALLTWLDEYTKPRQSELFVPTIQQDEQ